MADQENRKSYDENLEQPYNYLIWNDRRRRMISGAGSVLDELEFTNKILLSNPHNIQPWSHREWIIEKFDTNLWLPELRYCHEILDRDIFNVSAWDQICRAVELYPNMTKELRDVEVAYAKRVIYEHPGNEGPWSYLTFLYMKDLPTLYKNPDLERVYVDFLAEEADRIKFGAELDPPPGYRRTNYVYVDKRGCLNALSLVAALMVLGYEASLNRRLVEAVDVLIENLVGTYSHVDPLDFTQGSEFSRKVSALALSLDAFRIRYHKRCRGYNYLLEAFDIIDDDTDDYEEDEEEKEEEAFDIIYDKDIDDDDDEDKHQNSMRLEMAAMDICDNLPLRPLEEGFESWLTSNGFGGSPMEVLEGTLNDKYLKKQTQYNRDENDALEDLKWDARRVMVKLSGSNEVVLDELQFTTDIINDNAYNHRAWSHRQWVFHAFGEDWEDKAELEFCGAIIQKNPYNTFAWDQRYFVITRLVSRIYEEGWQTLDRELVGKYRACLDERRCEEREFALKFMNANPENHLPWGHISGLYNTYHSCPYHFCYHMSLLNAILSVLEKARDYRCLDEDNGSVMRLSGGSSASVSNARAVHNAISMLSEFTIDRGINLLDEDEYTCLPKVKADSKRFKAALDQLCPDSNIKYRYYSLKMCAIVGAMEKASTDCGQFVRHPIDELLTIGIVCTTF